jgi:pyridoxine/pyridoxamine 5'-phosphate oxidase
MGVNTAAVLMTVKSATLPPCRTRRSLLADTEKEGFVFFSSIVSKGIKRVDISP